jgi:hypothetical protein
MADVEELEIKIKVDSSEVKKAVSDKTPVKETGIGGQTGAKGGAGNIAGLAGKGKQGLGMAKGIAMNPMGAVMDMLPQTLMKFLPKMLLKAIPFVGWAVMAVEFVPIIIKEVTKFLTSVGSPFDKRFKRQIKNEVNGFFTREEQQRRRLGLDPVIITSTGGFRNNGGLQTVNTLNQVSETGVATIGLQDKALGVQ